MTTGQPIVAISSAVGTAPRMIVRLSGPGSHAIASKLCPALKFQPGQASREEFEISDLKFSGWVYVFKSPHSYTGQDLVEFHIPGNALLAQMLLKHAVGAGARPAEPGEFTARAYFNGRMDLAEAEGVAAAVSALNEQELRAARQLMAGELARRLRPAMDLLAETLALLEVGIDFSEEDVTFLTDADLSERLADIDAILAALLQDSARFERISTEPLVVLVGRPNAGKSTLLNALAGHERAVVSPIPGTTRDAISAEIALQRGIVRIMDIAGIEAPHADELTQKMQHRAVQSIEQADVVVYVREVNDQRPPVQMERQADISIISKSDLSPHPLENAPIAVSAQTGVGMPTLRDALDAACFGQASAGTSIALNTRHVQALATARLAITRAQQDAPKGAEIAALALRETLDVLGTILGNMSPDEVLGAVFAKFCIGK